VIHDVLEHHHRARLGKQLVNRRQRQALERRQGASVDMEARHLLGQGFGEDEAGRIRALQHVGQPGQPAWSHQERPHREP
jgi:hypothetical protein